MSPFLIERDSSDPDSPGRVYVTGPHFGDTDDSVFSSTQERAKATRYERAHAERLLRKRKWRGLDPVIVADDARV